MASINASFKIAIKNQIPLERQGIQRTMESGVHKNSESIWLVSQFDEGLWQQWPSPLTEISLGMLQLILF